MASFFGTPWDAVTAAVVEAFLADAGDEGLLWEAKGHGEPHRNSVLKAVCGLANSAGGFLILGAERASGAAWTLTGVEFRSAEPGTWLSSVIASGLHPKPWFDIKLFERDDGRVAAVVAVEPVAAPPCITATGVVYQRVVGQTLPVTDQRVLADLMARGRAVRAQAEALAVRAAARALAEPSAQSADESLLSVAICPTQGAEDKAAVLFSEGFAEHVREVVGEKLQVDPMVRYPVRAAAEQDSVVAYPASSESHRSWTAAVYWDGSVSAVYTTPTPELVVSDLIPRVNQAWRTLVGLAEAAGGVGEAHLAINVGAEHPSVGNHRGPHPRHPVRRWTLLTEPTTEELGSVQRELQRGFGQTAWEPER